MKAMCGLLFCHSEVTTGYKSNPHYHQATSLNLDNENEESYGDATRHIKEIDKVSQ